MLKVSWLDVKLGLRMFAKYPGLSLVTALYHVEAGYRVGMRGAPPAATPLLRATLNMSRAASAAGDQAAGVRVDAMFAARMNAWIQRLEAEPGISAVTFANRFPGEEGYATLEVEPDGAPGGSVDGPKQPVAIGAGAGLVATNFFEVPA